MLRPPSERRVAFFNGLLACSACFPCIRHFVVRGVTRLHVVASPSQHELGDGEDGWIIVNDQDLFCHGAHWMN